MDDQYQQNQYQDPNAPAPVAPVEGAPQEYAPQPAAEVSYGPRRMTFFNLVLKTFAGFGGGLAGTGVLLLIFLGTSSILQPVLGATAEGEMAAGEVSPLFMVVLMAMVFSTTLISSMLGTLLLCYTERERYTRVTTVMGQVFAVNLVIFAFVLPIYLTASTTRLELTAYAAGLQVILTSMASALILELIHDYRYPLLAVYNTILAMLVAVGLCFFIYFAAGNATIMLFAALPVIWALIGFSQAAVTMFYYWIFQTWGTDYLANSATFGADYGVPDQSEEEMEEPQRPDIEGNDFLKQ
ncbi:MAG TPA: hypothetical protein VI588_03235 [Candidatus Gracilibacteria bacterium]|nr:hypothetical protein [Candidatus Gracilibacteria bacterium]